MIDRNGRRVLEHLDERFNWRPAPPDGAGVRPATNDRLATDVSYPVAGIGVLDAHAEASWWIDHRARHAVDVLRARGITMAVDVGAGTGVMGNCLSAAGVDVLAVEPIANGATRIAARGHEVVHGTLHEAAFPAASLPAITLFDVIEHLEDPTKVIDEALRVLQPDGLLVITVPAHPRLWGADDEYAGHHRRYTRTTLLDAVESCGFRAADVRYLFASLVPPAFVARAVPRLLGRRREADDVERQLSRGLAPPTAVEWAIRRTLALEDAWARRHHLPFGLSLLGVFEPIKSSE